MPLYEYHCGQCEATFDRLRPFSKADEPIACPECQGEDTERVISAFASFSSDAGQTGGGCAGCSSGSCASCRR